MALNYDKIKDDLTARRSYLDKVFERHKSLYRDLQEYINPWSGLFLSSSPDNSDELTDGGKKGDKVFGKIAVDALETLASGMQSGITNPSRPWFRLGLAGGDTDTEEDPAVKMWLRMVEDMMYYIFAKSNAYQGLHQVYKELGCYNTGAMAVFENARKVIRSRVFTMGEYRFGLNEDLEVDTFLHYTWMSARSIVNRFGRENVSRRTLQAYENKQSEDLFQVCWLVEPNDDRIKARDFLNRAFRSIYWEPGTDEDRILSLGGFEEFPILPPRWEALGGKTYGSSGPGVKACDEVKMFYKMKEKFLVALDKEVDPPVVGPSALAETTVNTMPGGVTPIDEMHQNSQLRRLYSNDMDWGIVAQEIQNTQQEIRRLFYNDLFIMLATLPDTHQRTAREIAERHEEKLIMLGPVLERLHAELLDPLIDRTFNIMVRNDMVPPPPPAIEDRELQVEYISILAQAQKMVGASGINQFYGFIGSVAEVHPEVLDKVDFDQGVDIYADITGVPPNLVVPDDKVAAKRDKREKQLAMAQAAEAAPKIAQSAKSLADSNMEENNALNALLGRPAGGPA